MSPKTIHVGRHADTARQTRVAFLTLSIGAFSGALCGFAGHGKPLMTLATSGLAVFAILAGVLLHLNLTRNVRLQLAAAEANLRMLEARMAMDSHLSTLGRHLLDSAMQDRETPNEAWPW